MPRRAYVDGVLRVGLTGGIGSGKSEVARMLADRGAVVIDSDELAREVVAPGTGGHAQVVEQFGPEVLAPDGSLDRSALAKRIFADPAARQRLEAVIHPLVRARAAEVEAQAPPDAVVVHDIPLLVEAGLIDRFDVVVVVDAPVDTAVRRLVEHRQMSEQDARQRIDAQASRADRLRLADVVIDNSADLAGLRGQVDELWDDLASRAAGEG